MPRKRFLLIVLAIVTLFALAACGGGDVDTDAEAPAGASASNGEELYRMTTIGDAAAPGCITCHNLEPTDDPLQPSPVGPSHYGVADRAATYIEGMGAAEYLRESIVEPNAHIVEGFTQGVMYQNYATDLTDQQIDDLVAFLLTLEGE